MDLCNACHLNMDRSCSTKSQTPLLGIHEVMFLKKDVPLVSNININII